MAPEIAWSVNSFTTVQPWRAANSRQIRVAEGVAHAPDGSVTAPDSGADCDTGGKERRPIDRGEVADRKEHRSLLNSEPRTSKAGPLLPGLCSPLLFFAFVYSGSLQGPKISRRQTRLEGVPPSADVARWLTFD